MTPDDPTGRYLFEGSVYVVRQTVLPDGSTGFGAFLEGGTGHPAANSLEIIIEGRKLPAQGEATQDPPLIRGDIPSGLRSSPPPKSFDYVSVEDPFPTIRRGDKTPQ